ncbi:hypothetical protein [Maricaulis salignorans]|uniref:DUF4345 domain-containing protein n=1 Tax=Maricaulis salignorans TaxID=144026 RepID=A0A1G9M265_9PROT|nr:hypothetical protein [Maricaulis salignorans]SDL68372.1 hypothetical protein SAMN04488568_101301 [Maricaulis salignorans]
MQMILRAATALSALVLCAIGAAFLITPDLIMAPLGLHADGAIGLNFLRGDAGASLLLIGALAGRAALAGDGSKLDIPVAWAMLLLVGRIIGMVVDPDGLAALPLFAVDSGLLLVLMLGRWKMKRAV